MRKWILIFFPLILTGLFLQAQDPVGCSQLYQDAREAYDAGMVELVPELLLPCLEEGGLSGRAKQDAYKLVINAYLFDFLPDEAGAMMDRFVEEFPEYRAQDTDQAEFVLLLDAKLRERSIDPDQVQQAEEPEEPVVTQRPDQPTRQVPVKPPFEYGNSIGFQLGFVGSFPQMVERYSIGDPSLDEGSFGFQPGFQAGAIMNLSLGEVVETDFGLHFSRTSFSYTATPLSFASYTYKEHQNHLQLPVSFLFRLNPRASRVSVYLRAGFAGDYLISASGSGVRSYDQYLRDVEVDPVDIKNARSSLNLSGLAGLGVRIPLENSFIFIESRFTSGIFLVNKGENRYDNQDLIWTLYHVDSDFRMQQVSLLAGMAWNL
ncbi:MAG: outer membrane beta-barrel protein [Bacteroidales bacterium]